MHRSNNPFKRRQVNNVINDNDPFGFNDEDDDGNFECNFNHDEYITLLLGRRKKKSSAAASTTMASTTTEDDDGDIEILEDSSPEMFSFGTTKNRQLPSSSSNKVKRDSSESDAKKPKLQSLNSATTTSTGRPLLPSTTSNRSNSLLSKPKASNDKENSQKSNFTSTATSTTSTALNPPGTAPKKLTTQLASIFNPSNKTPESAKPEKNYNKAELASKYAAKKQAERDARYGATPSAKYVDAGETTYEGFRMANGSKEIIKEMKSITPHATKNSENAQSSSEPQKAQPSKSNSDSKSLKNHESLKHFEPHIIEHIESEILTTNVNVTWDAVAGLVQAKKTLREIVVFPFLRPDLFKGLRAPSKGVLLFGPPGTGKTLIARCVANQARATFFNVSVSTVMSKWVGEGEKVVRALFEVARLKLPSIIFIDEIDALLSARKDGDHESSRRVKTEFLIQMDGIATNSDERLLVLGATNKPEDIDEAARRRFPKRLYIALPDFDARKGMIQRHMASNYNVLNEADFTELANRTKGFSGADMFHLAKEAAYGPLRDVINDIERIPEEKLRPIRFDDFTNVLPTVKPTVLKDELDSYLEWDKKFGCHSS